MPARPDLPYDVLVLPHIAPDSIARGLVDAAPALPQVVALLLPLPEAGATAVLFTDDHCRAVSVDLDAVAAHMSTGGHAVGVAHGSIDQAERRWRGFRDGRPVMELGPDDELYLPVDEDGFPDLEAERLRKGDGVPDGYGRFRSCHDLGMKQTFSCRFGPVAHAVQRLAQGEEVGVEAYALVVDGHRVSTPTPLKWSGRGHPR